MRKKARVGWDFNPRPSVRFSHSFSLRGRGGPQNPAKELFVSQPGIENETSGLKMTSGVEWQRLPEEIISPFDFNVVIIIDEEFKLIKDIPSHDTHYPV